MKNLLKIIRNILISVEDKAPIRFWLLIKPYINRLFMNRYFIMAEFVSACVVIAFRWEVQGAVAFFWLILTALVLSNDILSPLPPMLFMSVFLTRCYDSADIFLEYMPLAIPAALAIIFHLVVYKHKWEIGPNFWGVVAVAVAVTLGGLGTISKSDYFNGTALYYVGALGIGMVIFYLIAKAYIKEFGDYDIYEKFAGILYAMGALACFAIICFYYPEWHMVKESRNFVNFRSSSNLATMLMITMPFPCYFALKNKKHLLGLLMIYLAVVLSGSRGGLIMGTVEFFFCLVYLAIYDKKSRFTYICVILAAFAIVSVNVDNLLYFYNINSPSELITDGEERYSLISRVGEDFKSNIFFGRGIGYSGNKDIYDPVKGAIFWYHMMIPQIIGSFGLLGVVSYIVQWVIRAKTVLYKTDSYRLILGVSYLGLFLMSQVNPGEFCPIPYSLIAVLVFVMAEKHNDYVKKTKGIDAKPSVK